MYHSNIYEELNNARIADHHRQAERSRLARVCVQVRRARRENSKDLADGAVGVSARRLLVVLGARG